MVNRWTFFPLALAFALTALSGCSVSVDVEEAPTIVAENLSLFQVKHAYPSGVEIEEGSSLQLDLELEVTQDAPTEEGSTQKPARNHRIEWRIEGDGAETEFVQASGEITLLDSESSFSLTLQATTDAVVEADRNFSLIFQGERIKESSASIVSIVSKDKTIPAQLSIQPAFINFGTSLINTATEISVEVQNIGHAPAHTTQLSVEGPGFSLVDNQCGGTLTGGQKCSAKIRFNSATEVNSAGAISAVSEQTPDPVSSPLIASALQIVVEVTGLPTGRSNDISLDAIVGGSNVEFYRYKVGQTTTTNCSTSTGYSSLISASVPLTDLLFADGNYRVCVIGASQSGVAQPFSQATAYTWIKDTSRPTVTIAQSSGQVDPAKVLPMYFTLTMSEAINESTFSAEDIRFVGSSEVTAFTLTKQSSTSWQVRVDSIGGPGTVQLVIFEDSFMDLADNRSLPSIPADNVITFDASAPSPATFLGWLQPYRINQTEVHASWLPAVDDDLSQQEIQFYSDGSCSNPIGTPAILSKVESTKSIIGVHNNTFTYRIRSLDSALNTSTSDCSSAITIDLVQPEVSGFTPAAGVIAGTPASVTVTFNEAMDPASLVPARFSISCNQSGQLQITGVSVLSATQARVNLAIVQEAANGEQCTLNALVGSKDVAGNNSKASSVTYTYDLPAWVDSVSSITPDGTYKAGDEILVDVKFNEIVTLSGSGPPTLKLNTGDTPQLATYVSGSGSTDIRFSYTVQAGDNITDLDYFDRESLTLNGASLKDSFGSDSKLTLPPAGGLTSLAGAKNIVLDTTPPGPFYIFGVRGGVDSFTDAYLTDDSVIRGDWTQPQDGVNYRMTVLADNGTTVLCTGPLVGTLNSTIDPCSFTDLSYYKLRVEAFDQVGNGREAEDGLFRFRALTGAVISTISGQPTGLTNNPILNATVSGDNIIEYRYKIGTSGSINCSDTNGYSAFTPVATPISEDLTGLGNTSIRLCVLGKNVGLAEQDPNDATIANWSQDLTKPSVTINQKSGSADPINALPIQFTIVFSEAVNPSTFTTSDITQSGTATGITWSLTSSNNITWTLSATAIAAPGTVIPSLAAGVVSDPAGNTNFVSTSTDNSVTYDITKPTVTINQKVGQNDPVNSLPIEFTVVFSEPINAATFTASDISQVGSASGVSWSIINVNPTTWTAQATSISVAGTVIPTISANKVNDLAGNTNSASTATDNSVLYDITPPNNATGLKWSVASPTNNTTITAQWTVSNSSDKASQSVRLYTGAACASYTGTANAVAATTATTNFTGANGTTYSFNVVTTDHAGNQSTSACSGTITVDTTPPTITNVTSAAANGSYKSGAIIDVRVTFSEEVLVVGGPALALNTTPARSASFTSGSGNATIVFNYAVQNGDNVGDLNYVATNSLTIGAGVTIRDRAGNNATLTLPNPAGAGSLGTNKNIEVDTLAPVINSFSITTTSPTNTTNWALSSSVNGTFTKYCILENNTSISSCAWANGTSVPTSRTVTSTQGSKTLSLWLQDAAGNTSARYGSNTVTLDTTPPTATMAGQPTGVSNKYALNINVAGTQVVEYRYKLGRSSTTTCSSSSGYSSAVAVSTNIIQDISNNTTYPNGGMRACVVGKDAAGNWQTWANATVADWTKDFPTVSFTAASSSVNEFGSPTHNVTASLSRSLNGTRDVNVLVDYAMAGSGSKPASANVDFASNGGTLTFTSSASSRTIPVEVIDDNRQEFDETLTLSLSNLRGALNGTTMSHVVTITDNDPAPTIIMRDVSGIEGTLNIKMLATLSHPTDKSTVSFNWSAASCAGTDCATNPGNYTISPSSGSVSFSPGEISKTFPTAGSDGVDSVNDAADNVARKVFITASGASNGTLGRSFLHVLLNDDDVPAGKAVQKITANRFQSCAIAGSGGAGNLYCWGNNAGGELGLGDYVERTAPAHVSSLSSSVTDVSAGYGHTCAVDNGAAKCWGADSISGAGPGALGKGSTGNAPTPQAVSGMTSGVTAVASGYFFSCGLQAGAVKCWGDNRKGQTGKASSTNSFTSPQSVPSPMDSSVAAIGVGQAHACGLKSGVVYCWGRDDFGELGRGSGNQTTHVPTALSIPGTVTHLWVGYSSNCAKNNSGHVYCWGYNPHGMIDTSTSGNVESPTRVSALDNSTKIDFGQHICGLIGGVVKCRGSNRTGALGLNQPTNHTVTSWTNVPMFATASSAVDVAVSYEGHTCVVRTGGQAFCFGLDSHGQLGISSTVRRDTRTLATSWSAPTYANMLHESLYTTCGLISGGVHCSGNNAYDMVGTRAPDHVNSFPVSVPTLESGVTHIGGNNYANCARTSAGAVRCWGLAGYVGLNGTVNTTNPTTLSGLSSGASNLFSGPVNTCAIKSGKAYCWGNNSYGQLGNGTTTSTQYTPVEIAISGKSITQVSIGLQHICVLAGGGVFCSGRNNAGQLGNGTTTNSTSFISVPGFESGVSAIGASYYAQCAINTSKDLYCWGGGRENGSSGSSVLNPTLVRANILKVAGGSRTMCAIEDDTTATDADRLLCWGWFTQSQFPIGSSGCSSSGKYCNTPANHSELNALGKIIDLDVGQSRVCARGSGSSTNWSCTGLDTNSSMGTEATSVFYTPISISPL